MSHWHLTVGEIGLFVPGGVILGAVVSYLAVRNSTNATLAVQRAALDDARAQAAEQRRSELAREERNHRREAYTDLGGQLQLVVDNCNYMVGPVLGASLEQENPGGEGAGAAWSAFYAQILDALPGCRRLASVYGSPDVRAAVNALGALARALAPPDSFADSREHWMHQLGQRDNGITVRLTTLNSDHHMHDTILTNIQIFESIARFGLARIRYEMLPTTTDAPTRPPGVAHNPDLAAYVHAQPSAPR